MALHFSEDFIQEVIDKNDIVDYISKSVRLKRTGSTYKGLCPFHKEKTPSFSVSPDKQLYYCFGCGKGGTVINYVMQSENLDFVEAVRALAERSGIEVPESGGQYGDTRQLQRQTACKINATAGRFFYDQLFGDGGGSARAYAFEKRGLDRSTINKFGIGFAPDGNALLQYLREAGFTDDEILSSGVVGKSENGDLYDRFRCRLMFPIIDVRRNVIGFGGRALRQEDEDRGKKYINSPETVAFNKSYNLFGLNFAKSTKEDYLLLVEGNLDVVMLHQHGIDSAVATLGTALTPEQARLIKRFKQEVILAYDNDGAGQKATRRAIELLTDEGLRVRVLTMHGAKDPDEYIRQNGVGAFRKLIQLSKMQIEYKLEKLKEQYTLEDTAQRVEYVNGAARELAQLKSPVECEIYVKKVSEETGVSPESIFAEIARLRALADKRAAMTDFQTNGSVRAQKPSALRKQRVTNAQKLALNLICYQKKEAEALLAALTAEDFDEGGLRRIFEILRDVRQSGGEPDGRLIVARLPDVPAAAEILHDDRNIDDPALAARQVLDIIQEQQREKRLHAALQKDGLTQEKRLEEINEVLGSSGKRGGTL